MNKGLGKGGGHIATVVVFTGMCVAWVAYILNQSGVLPTLGEKYKVTATVQTAALLAPGARITVAGAQVGRVTSIKRASKTGPDAKIGMQITDKRVIPFPDDSRVQIRTRSQVGENYVSITVGRSARTVADGGELGLDNAEEIVGIDQILSVLQGKTKERTRTLLQEFGRALAGRGEELNHTVSGFNGFAAHGGELVDIMSRSHEDTAEIVDHLGRLMSAVGDRGSAIDAIAARGRVAFRAIADRDDQLASTLRELPSTLRAIRRTSATVGTVGDESAPVIENLATSVGELQPAVRAFSPAARSSVKLVSALDAARRPVGDALEALARLGFKLPKTYNGLEKAVCQLNPMLRHLNPYADDLLTVVYGLGSSSNAYDATGHTIRLLPIANETSAFGAPKTVLEAEKTLLQAGALLPQKSTSYDAYMKPGLIGTTVASKDGQPAGPAEQSAKGFKYPQVKADC